MAFLVPEHLPKRPIPIDVSSKILYKIDSATWETLNSSLASSWINELDETIQATKQSIHDRIQSDLPTFQHQLKAAISIQTQFEQLNNKAEELEHAISDTKTGISPRLIATLKRHSELAQESSDADALYEGLSYLIRFRNNFLSLTSLVQSGQLPDAVVASDAFKDMLDKMPEFLSETKIARILKKSLTSTKAMIQDQLSEAFSRCVTVSSTEILICSTVQVRQCEATLSLASVLHSLSPMSLSNHLATLRRDILANFVDQVLTQPYSISSSTNMNDAKLSLIPDPTNVKELTPLLDNLSNILVFLSSNFFSHLPAQDHLQFTRSLIKPIMTSVLNNILILSLPSSFGLLPSYLNLLKRAVLFEDDTIRVLSNSENDDGIIKTWADGISGHYERRRRVEILELARSEIIGAENITITFEAISDGGLETSLPSAIPTQGNEDFKAWDFDEPATSNPVEADDWGFDDDDMNSDEDLVSELTPSQIPRESEAGSLGVDQNATGVVTDPGDSWGWNEELLMEETSESDAWDDPWSDSPDAKSLPKPTTPPSSFVSPKIATRLEKQASKKKHLNGHSPSVTSPISPPTVNLPFASPVTHPAPKYSINSKRPANIVTEIVPQEVYKVPKFTKRILKMVEGAIDESKLFFASNLFQESKDSSYTPGSILSQTATSILELYQAVYPIVHSEELKSPGKGMLFSNSAQYMIGAIQRLEDTIYGQPTVKERFEHCRRLLQILGDCWFEDVIEQEQMKVEARLSEAEGLKSTGDQTRYDNCEMTISDVLKDIKQLAKSLKGILAKNRYFLAIGAISNVALSRVLRDVLALPDIPEIESHRLSELCRIFNALEGLFNDDPEQPSFVVAYVPSWLKFSYLSELLEASLADVTYLFEQGALVDFEVEELVSLVRALFADTPLRTSTINKLLTGHPPPPS